jgi:predicted RND superfamily exporter protein
MFFLYGSLKVMFISMGVNIVPLFLVAGLMGFWGIPLKPSTALIFEMAFGIVIDSAVRYLSSYQWYYRRHPWPERAAIVSLHHTGALIIYTSLVLLAGFVIFIPSSFGGTKSLGILTALCIGMGLFSNLFLLPAMLITLRQADEGQIRKYARTRLTRLREKRANRQASQASNRLTPS